MIQFGCRIKFYQFPLCNRLVNRPQCHRSRLRKMRPFWLTVCLSLLTFHFVCSSPTFEISLPVGRVRGVIQETINGKSIRSCLGIPYAKPPVGPLRFKVGFRFKYLYLLSSLQKTSRWFVTSGGVFLMLTTLNIKLSQVITCFLN